MTVIDAQLHEPSVSLSWDDSNKEIRSQVLTELQLGLLRSAGVDRAVLFPIDLEWGLGAATQFPDRFGLVPVITEGGVLGGIDAGAPDLEDIVAEMAANLAVVGLRILRTLPKHEGSHRIPALQSFEPAVTACERNGLPLFMLTAGDFDAPAEIAKRHPDLTVIIDHLALPQPPTHPRESPPLKSVERVLALGAIPNIAVKLSGLPTLSQEPYPYPDLWPHLRRFVDAFGADRLMWGSDISRIQGRVGFDIRIAAGEQQYEGKHTYAEALLYLRETTELSESEKKLILGGAAQKLMRWSTLNQIALVAGDTHENPLEADRPDPSAPA